MAAKERIPGDAPAQRKRTTQDYDGLDVELLCKKLEIAKSEREERNAAALLRKQVRSAVRHENNASQGSERPQLSKRTSTSDGSKRSSWYKLPATLRKSQPTLDISIPENGREDQFDFVSPVIDHGILDQEERELVLLSRDSTPDEDADRRRLQTKAKRSSFTVLKRFTSNDREQLRRTGDAAEERPTSAHRRAQTVPFFKSKFISSKLSLAPPDAKDSCRASDEDDNLGCFVNEYTISFDTCPVKENMRHQPREPQRPTAAPVQRTRLGSNEGMRSLLNLGTILRKEKKDRPQFRMEEIPDPIQEDEEDPYARRPHTRSQTAPEELICDAAIRLKKEDKTKKRRTVSNLLQSFIAPNHSMSMHNVAI